MVTVKHWYISCQLEDRSDFTKNAAKLIISKFSSEITNQEIIVEEMGISPRGSAWKKRQGRDELAKKIGMALMDEHLVIINFDSDKKYSELSNPSVRRELYEPFEKLKERVRNFLKNRKKIDDDRINAFLKSLIPMVPSKNFESWSYFNKTKLKELTKDCNKLKDEVEKILKLKDKDFDENCVSFKDKSLKSIFNEELIRKAYPYQSNLSLHKSMSEFYEVLEGALLDVY